MVVTIAVLSMFRAPTVADGFRLYAGMAGMNGWIGDGVHLLYPGLSLLMIPVAYLLVYLVEPLYIGRQPYVAATPLQRHADLAYLAVALPLFMLAVSRLLSQSYSPFLYFAF
jgi:hypothetical protein